MSIATIATRLVHYDVPRDRDSPGFEAAAARERSVHQRADDEFNGTLQDVFGLRVTRAEHARDGRSTQGQHVLVEARTIWFGALEEVS